jgi:hypothetical protein
LAALPFPTFFSLAISNVNCSFSTRTLSNSFNIKEKDNQIEELKQNLDINHELILKLESEKNNLMLEKEKMEHSVTEIHQEVSDRDISVDNFSSSC